MLRDGVIRVGNVHVLSEFIYMNETAPIVQKKTTFITQICVKTYRDVLPVKVYKSLFLNSWKKSLVIIL